MKIPGNNDETKKPQAVTDAGAAQKAKIQQLKDSKPDPLSILDPEVAATSNQDQDSVTVSNLSALLSAQLDPTKMAAERSEKLQRIKQQIQNGTYPTVPSELVGTSVANEISMEILLAKKDDEPLI